MTLTPQEPTMRLPTHPTRPAHHAARLAAHSLNEQAAAMHLYAVASEFLQSSRHIVQSVVCARLLLALHDGRHHPLDLACLRHLEPKTAEDAKLIIFGQAGAHIAELIDALLELPQSQSTAQTFEAWGAKMASRRDQPHP